MAITLTQVPEELREYFGSEQTTAALRNISEMADIVIPRALPKMIYLLETKQISVHDFVETVQNELKTTPEKAKAIAKEIKEKILEPKRYTLSQWGIDISFIDVINAPPLAEKEEEKEKIISFEEIPSFAEATEGKPKETIIKPAETQTASSAAQPFILHEEKPLEENPPARGKKPSAKGFSMPFRFFKPGAAQTTPTSEIKASVQAPSERTVHYSEFRTPLTPFEGEAITFKKPEEEKPAAAEAVTNKEEIKKSFWPLKFAKTKIEKPSFAEAAGPVLEGNVINLKKDNSTQ